MPFIYKVFALFRYNLVYCWNCLFVCCFCAQIQLRQPHFGDLMGKKRIEILAFSRMFMNWYRSDLDVNELILSNWCGYTIWRNSLVSFSMTLTFIYICMHSDGWNLVKWEIQVDSVFCYWSKWPWSSFKVTCVWESKIFCANDLTKFLINLDGICMQLRLVDLMNLFWSVSREKAYFGDFCLKDKVGMVWTLKNWFLSNLVG